MGKGTAIALTLLMSLVIGWTGIAPHAYAQDVKPLRVVSEQTVKGFGFPETVTYDPEAKVFMDREGLDPDQDQGVALADASVDADRRAEFIRLMQQDGAVADFESQVHRRDAEL